MGQLTTHVLDISGGLPAAGVRIELHQLDAAGSRLIVATETGKDGRCPAPLMAGSDFRVGRYSLCFHLADYLFSRPRGHTSRPAIPPGGDDPHRHRKC
jgi:5-hydroxyisourate hydrolase